jgi:hypothetical protein
MSPAAELKGLVAHPPRMVEVSGSPRWVVEVYSVVTTTYIP